MARDNPSTKSGAGIFIQIYSVCDSLNGDPLSEPIWEGQITICSIDKNPLTFRAYAERISIAVAEALGEGKCIVEARQVSHGRVVVPKQPTIRDCDA